MSKRNKSRVFTQVCTCTVSPIVPGKWKDYLDTMFNLQGPHLEILDVRIFNSGRLTMTFLVWHADSRGVMPGDIRKLIARAFGWSGNDKRISVTQDSAPARPGLGSPKETQGEK